MSWILETGRWHENGTARQRQTQYNLIYGRGENEEFDFMKILTYVDFWPFSTCPLSYTDGEIATKVKHLSLFNHAYHVKL